MEDGILGLIAGPPQVFSDGATPWTAAGAFDALVQEWINGVMANNGLLLKAENRI